MPDECRENCTDHSGQEERINSVGGKLSIVLWLLGILITIMIGCTGVMYSSIQGLNYSLAGMTGRFDKIEAKFTIMEATDQRITDRLDRLERDKR